MKLFTSRNHHISQKTCWGIHTETRTKLRLWVALDALKRSDQTIKALWTPRATETFQYCRSAHFRPLPPTNHSYAQINHSYFIQPYLTLHRKWKLYHSSASVSSQDNCIMGTRSAVECAARLQPISSPLFQKGWSTGG